MKNIKIFILFFGHFFSSCASHTPKENLETTKKILKEVYLNDQKYRLEDYQNNLIKQDSIDKENLQIVNKIIDSLGWLSKDLVGDTANAALFLVIQHSNKQTMEKYLPILTKAVAEKKDSKQNLALLIDRIEILNNRKQIYGSQIWFNNGKINMYEAIEPEKINERRKEMELEKIEDYLQKFIK